MRTLKIGKLFLHTITDWQCWGIGFTFDWRARVATLELGPVTFELDFDIDPLGRRWDI